VIEIRHYASRAGKDIFDDWLSQLTDARARAKIAGRINPIVGLSKVLKKGRNHHETQSQHFPRRGDGPRLRKDPDFAAEYLKAALEDCDDPRVLLIALRRLAQAQGIAKVAKAAGIERESLYRALSVRGNPRLSTLFAATKAVGPKLTVEAAQ
jgi:probable addiction module antidote protein